MKLIEGVGDGDEEGQGAMKKTVPFVLILLWLAAPAAAQMKLKIFELRNRSAAEMVEVIRPLLGGEGTVTGTRDQLIVRTTPKNLAMVRQVLAQLDRALRNLKITVRQGTRNSLERQEAEVDADIPVEDKGRVIISDGKISSGGVTGSVRGGDGEVRARIGQRSHRSDEEGLQQVVTLDGQPAVIHITRSVPFTELRTVRRGGRVVREEGVVFKNVTTGVSVLPRIQGDRVVLEVRPMTSKLGPRGIETQEIITTVSGRLGEWIELGGLAQSGNTVHQGISEAARSSRHEDRKVFLKVEEQ